MSTQSRNAILLAVLTELRDREITVTGVRDAMLQRNPDEELDPAALRRWINGQFVTLVRKRVMIRHIRDDRRNALFTITGAIENSPQARKPPNKRKSFAAPTQSTSLSALKNELESIRLKALTELSEIDEYKRITKQYPDLSTKAKVKFDTAIEENCKTLGRIKALEEILEYKAPTL